MLIYIYIYIKILNRPCRVAWFKSTNLNHWKWHFLNLTNTLEGANTQTIASITIEITLSHTYLLSGYWGMTLNCLYSGVENIISVCIVRLLNPLGVYPGRTVFFLVKTHFFPQEWKKYFSSGKKSNPVLKLPKSHTVNIQR